MGNPVQRAKHSAVLVWIVATAAAAAAAALDYKGQAPMSLPLVLGFIFAFYVVATRTIAGRYKDLTTLALATMGGLFGYWFPGVYEFYGEIVAGWISSEVVPGWLGQQLVMPLSVVTSGIIAALMLYVGTGSDRVLRVTILTSIAVAASAFIPYDETIVLAVAAATWHAFVCAVLGAWAITSAERFQSNSCAFCGFDLEGLRVQICPACKRPAASAGPAYRAAVSDHARQNELMRSKDKAKAKKDAAPDGKSAPAPAAASTENRRVYRIGG